MVTLWSLITAQLERNVDQGNRKKTSPPFDFATAYCPYSPPVPAIVNIFPVSQPPLNSHESDEFLFHCLVASRCAAVRIAGNMKGRPAPARTQAPTK